MKITSFDPARRTFSNSALVVILIGVISSILSYRFGISDHVEQLPIVMRAMDSSFLVNDFFTNATDSFGPRFYYVHTLAFISKIISLPLSYFLFTIMANTSIAIVSYLFAKELFDKSKIAGIISACAVMSLGPFALGASAFLRTNTLTPSYFIMPLLLGSLWAAMKDNILLAASLAGIASLFHPLLGLGTGCIVLSMFVLSVFHRQGMHVFKTRMLLRLALSSAILLSLSALSLIPYMFSEKISSAEFVNIVAFFRAPHHYVPSFFGALQYVLAIAFYSVAVLAWNQWRKQFVSEYGIAEKMVWLAIILACLYFGGWFFVEVYPSRLWVSAQVFRFLFLSKWIAMILIAGSIGYSLERRPNLCSDNYIKLISLLSPVTMLITHFALTLKPKRVKEELSRRESFGAALLLIVNVVILWLVKVSFEELFLFTICILLYFIFIQKPEMATCFTKATLLVGIVFICILPIALLMQQVNLRQMLEGRFKTLAPQFLLPLSSPDERELIEFVRSHTPDDALFLTPPLWGEFRLSAQRAIIVDFRGFPFQDLAMLEWLHRSFDCYGIPNASGFAAGREMDRNYRKINDWQLRELQKKYGFDYTVLFAETPSALPSVFKNKTYKIIAFPLPPI